MSALEGECAPFYALGISGGGYSVGTMWRNEVKMIYMTRNKVGVIALVFATVMSIHADSEYSNGYTWRYSIDGDVSRIYGMTVWSSEFCGEVPSVSPKPVGALTIPSMLGGKPMTYIGDLALASCNDLTVVIIPDCVTHIDCRSFAYCDRPPERIDFKGPPPVVVGYYDTITML